MRIGIVMTEVMGIACGDDAIDGQPTGVAMIGMKSVTLPGIVGENNIRFERPDPVRNLIANVERGLEFAVGMAEHDDFASGPK